MRVWSASCLTVRATPLLFLSGTALALSGVGCAPLYPVQIAPLGNDTYLATQASQSSWLDARAAALQRAAAWCDKKGGAFAAVNSDQQRASFGLTSNDHASVEFTCTGVSK